ncbi:YceI family protein [Chitinibacteraceae bacterium HSL-7]
MKSVLLPLLTLGVLAAPLASAQTLNAKESKLGFTFTQMAVPVDGEFRQFDAKVSFDPAKPQAAQATFTVDLGSIDVGGPDGNAEAKKKAWFDTGAFPKATFTAKEVKALGNNAFEARGPLAIKGISRDVVARFTSRTSNKGLVLEGGFPLKRLDYKLGTGVWSDTGTVEDEVKVKFRFVLTQP